jgi:transcriptional regulator with XRE-family HTH domain
MPARNEPHRPLTALKALRERAGLSQDELAAKVSISQSKLSRIERGYLHAKTHECERLARALGVTVGALMTAAKASSAAGEAP